MSQQFSVIATLLMTSLLHYDVTNSLSVANNINKQHDVTGKTNKVNNRRAADDNLHKDEDLIVDLRAHKLFLSNPRLDCCPTITQINRRAVAINPHGLVLELFQTENFTQAFYETVCDPTLKDRPCQFIDPGLSPYSRCVQQWSYVYAMGRTFGHLYEQFRFDYIRVATGCKCQLPAHVAKQRNRQSAELLVQP